MNIDLLKPAGVKLKTAGKFCGEDIMVKPLLQSKSVTANGTVTPDSGYAGLSSVSIHVPASEAPAYDGSITVVGVPAPSVLEYNGAITVV